jgi:hypothetical protein
MTFSADGRDHSYSNMLVQRNYWMDILSRWERPFLLQYVRPEKLLDDILSRWERLLLLQYARPENDILS